MAFMSTERQPLFTVEMSDKFEGVFFVVQWQNGVFGALGRQVDGAFYDREDAVASLQAHWHDWAWDLQHAEVA